MSRLILIVLLLAAGSLFAGGVFAQEATPDPTVILDMVEAQPCLGLGDADCIFLQTASSAEPATSAGFIAQMLVTATDPTETDSVPRDVTALTVIGRYTVAPEALADLNADVSGAARVRAILNAAEIDAEVTVYTPAEAESGTELDFTSAVTFDLRIAGGMAYVNFDTIDGEDDEDDVDGWYSLSVDRLVGALGLPRASLLATLVSPGFDRGIRSVDLFGLPAIAGYGVMDRLEIDPEMLNTMVGDDVVVFQTIYDVGSFLSDPATEGPLMELLQTEAELRGEDMLDPDPIELYDNRRSLFGDSVIRFIDYLTPEEGRLLRRDIVIDDLVIGGAAEGEADAQARVLSMAFAVQYLNFDPAGPVEIPGTVAEAELASVLDAFGFTGGAEGQLIRPDLLVVVDE